MDYPSIPRLSESTTLDKQRPTRQQEDSKPQTAKYTSDRGPSMTFLAFSL